MRPSMQWFQSCSELPWTPKDCSHTPLSRLYSTMFHDSIMIVACMLLLGWSYNMDKFERQVHRSAG